MATKKKVVKTAKKVPAKKTVKHAAKKVVSAKKPIAKATKKAIPKKLVKAAVAVKKPAAAKKPTVVPKHMIKKTLPAAHLKTLPAKPSVSKTDHKKPEVKQPLKTSAPVVQKPEIKKPTLPAKPTQPAKPVKVVIPEMKTKTIRKYEPEFTKSVLDTLQQESSGPTMRYSDVELAEFRDLIMKKLEAAKKELAYLQGLITRKDEMGGDDTDNRYMTMEDGSMSMEREQLSQMASRQITFIDHLEKALMRIENKTYGICRVTGKLIDKARLKAVPHATLSIEAKQTMNK
jgi:RNA polymerase-binding transcription factor DksA